MGAEPGNRGVHRLVDAGGWQAGVEDRIQVGQRCDAGRQPAQIVILVKDNRRGAPQAAVVLAQVVTDQRGDLASGLIGY